MKFASLLFILAIIIPPNYSIAPGGFVITPIRGLGMIYFLIFVPQLFRSNSFVEKVTIPDLAVTFHCIWAFIAIYYWHGGARAVESVGIYSIEFLGLYAFGRCLALELKNLQYFLRVFLIVVIVSALFAWFESLTGKNLVYSFLGLPFYRLAEPRLGLERASVYMQHPILYGLFISMMMGLVIYTVKGKVLRLAVIFLAAVIPSLSSAPLLSIVVQLGATLWDQLLKNNTNRWKIALVLAVIAYLAIEIPSDRSFVAVVISYLTFNPWTGYYRMMIWEYGIQEVLSSPLLGIGFNDWSRASWMYSNSVDNFWLLTMMRYGIPALIFMAIPVFVSARKMIARDFGNLLYLKTGWLISLLGVIFVGGTVHFWANIFSMFSLFIGLGVTIASYRDSVLKVYQDRENT